MTTADSRDRARRRISDERTAGAHQNRLTPRQFLWGTVVIVALVGAYVALLVTNDRAAESAARSYVELIEQGRIAEASALVPVDGTRVDSSGFLTELPEAGTVQPGVLVDQALLSDEFYASASNRLVLDSLQVPRYANDDTEIGGTILARVNYHVGETETMATITLERVANNWLGMPQWKVRDSLAIGLHLQTLEGAPTALLVSGSAVLTSPYVDGAVTARELLDGATATMLYPGEYPISAPPTEFVSLAETHVTIAEPAGGNRSTGLRSKISVAPTFEPTEALYERVVSAIEKHLADCTTIDGAAAAQSAGNTCPGLFDPLADTAAGRTATVTELPTVTALTPASPPQLNSAPWATHLAFTFVSNEGAATITNPDGSEYYTSTIRLWGVVIFDGASVRVIFE